MNKAEERVNEILSKVDGITGISFVGYGISNTDFIKDLGVKIYEQSQKDFMAKAEKWLSQNARDFGRAECADKIGFIYKYDIEKLVDSFKQAMSE